MKQFLIVTMLLTAMFAGARSVNAQIGCLPCMMQAQVEFNTAFNSCRDSSGCTDPDCSNCVGEGTSAKYDYVNSTCPICGNLILDELSAKVTRTTCPVKFSIQTARQRLLVSTEGVSASRRFKVDAFDFAWAGVIVGDKLSTDRAFNRCPACYEGSPFKNVAARMGFQFAMLGSVKVLEYYNPGHVTLFRVFKSGMVALGSGVILHNLRK